MRSSLSRLASPPKAAASALQELGVAVADDNGKMRPMETVLLDLFKATQKYGQVDQVSFFKNIAGEEAFVGLQTLVQAAGSGELQKLTKELQSADGESAIVAKKMANNLGGDLKELDSAWEAFRIQIEELADGALRKLTQVLSGTIGVMTEWAKNNPQLTKTLLAVGGGALALTAGIGAASLTIGMLLGPLAKLQLGFSLLTGMGWRAHSGRHHGTSQRFTLNATRWRVASSHTRYCLARHSPPWRLTGLSLATSTWKSERTDSADAYRFGIPPRSTLDAAPTWTHTGLSGSGKMN